MDGGAQCLPFQGTTIKCWLLGGPWKMLSYSNKKGLVLQKEGRRPSSSSSFFVLKRFWKRKVIYLTLYQCMALITYPSFERSTGSIRQTKNWKGKFLFFTDTMDLTDDEAGGQAITLRPTLHQHSPPRPSSTPGSLTLEVESHRIIPLAPSSEGEDEVPASFKVPSIFSCQSLDMDGGSHSSEEELEEINKIMKPTLASLNSNSCKNNLIPNSSSSSPPPIPTTPVEFSTTPPNHVHKPRRSTSPPPLVIRRSQTPTPHEVVLPSFKEFTRSQSQHLDDRRSERRAIGSKKRYKQSRIHHLQRPCLDFEKMQLVSTNIL